MPEPSHADFSLNGRPPLYRTRGRGVLLACLVLSITLHAAVFALLPAFMLDSAAPPVRVLDVVLVQPPALPPAELPASPAPAAKQPAAKPPVTGRAPAAATRKAMQDIAQGPEPRQQVLSEQRNQAPSVPAPAQDAAPVAPPAPQAPQKSAWPAPAPEAAPLTPPVFNASYLRNPPPRYPLIARRNGEQGTVTLRVRVTQQGMPANVDIEASSGSSHLDSAALEAVRGWRFVPAHKGSEPVEAWVLVPVVFRLEG